MTGPASFTINPRDREIEATHTLLASEIRPGNTVSFVVEVDLTAIEALRSDPTTNEPSILAFVVRALAKALEEFPYANRRVQRVWFPWPGPRLQRFQNADVAVAADVDAPGGEADAVVKIVRAAENLSAAEIETMLADAIDERSRTYAETLQRVPSRLASYCVHRPWFVPRLWAERKGGAVLVSTPGVDVADAVIGVWSYPLGVSIGRACRRPVVIDGAIVARPVLTLTLNFDRRVMAGAQAARFFRRIVERLEEPEFKTIREP